MTKAHEKEAHMTKNQQGKRQNMQNTKERKTQNITFKIEKKMRHGK